MSNDKNVVVPLFPNKKQVALQPVEQIKLPTKQEESPFINFPPGARLEFGLGCVFISIPSTASFAVRRNWSTWIKNIEPRLVAAGFSFELMQERKGFVDGLRIRVLVKSAERMPPL